MGASAQVLSHRKVPEVGPLSRAVNVDGGAAVPQEPAPPLPPVAMSPEQEQTLLALANARNKALTDKANGTKDVKTTAEDGTPVTIPGKQPEFLTPAEKEEQAFLAENGGDVQALARAYPGVLAQPAEQEQQRQQPETSTSRGNDGDNAGAGVESGATDGNGVGANPRGAVADSLGQSGEQAGGSDAGAVTPEKQAITDGYALDKTRDSGVRIFRKTDDAGRHMRAINAEGELITSTSNFGEFTISDSYLEYDGPQAFVVSMDNKRGHLTAKNKESGQLIELSPRADKEFADGIPLAKVLETEFSDAGGIKPDGSKTPHTTTVKKSAPTAKQKSNVTTPVAPAASDTKTEAASVEAPTAVAGDAATAGKLPGARSAPVESVGVSLGERAIREQASVATSGYDTEKKLRFADFAESLAGQSKEAIQKAIVNSEFGTGLAVNELDGVSKSIAESASLVAGQARKNAAPKAESTPAQKLENQIKFQKLRLEQASDAIRSATDTDRFGLPVENGPKKQSAIKRHADAQQKLSELERELSEIGKPFDTAAAIAQYRAETLAAQQAEAPSVDELFPLPAAPAVSTLTPSPAAPSEPVDIKHPTTGKPFTTMPGALKAQKLAGDGHEVVKVDGGFVVRAKDTNGPSVQAAGLDQSAATGSSDQPGGSGVTPVVEPANERTGELQSNPGLDTSSGQTAPVSPASTGTDSVAPSGNSSIAADENPEWTRMPHADRLALNTRAGMSKLVADKIARTPWADITPKTREKITAAMAAPVRSSETANAPEATPTKDENTDGINDHIRALRAVAHKGIKQGGPKGDVRLSTDPSLYAPFDDVVAEARKAVAAGTRPVPFQIHNALDIGIGETDRVIAALNVPVAKPVTPQVPTKKPTKQDQTASDREKARSEYFTPGNIVKSYGGYDEVLSYTTTGNNGSGWRVNVHEVKMVDGQWVRQGKPQDARTHSTQPDARELKQGPVTRLGHQPAGEVVYSEPRADGKPFPNAVDRGTKPVAQAESAQSVKLETIAERLGFSVNKSATGWHARGGMISIPSEDADLSSAVSADHVFAHELGHGIMDKRGVSVKGFPDVELRKRVANWDELVSASKEFRPGVHNHASDSARRHAKKANEIAADAIASVLIGDKPLTMLQPFMDWLGINKVDLGLQTVAEANAESRAAKVSEPKASQALVNIEPIATESVAPAREAIEHVGVKIYPVTFKDEPRWAVQTDANKTSGKVFGDTIHSTLDEAKQEAERQVARVKSQQERSAAHEAEAAAAQAKKDANKGKSIVERRKEAILDGATKLPVQAGLGNGTKRESMQKAVDQERAIVEKMVDDPAAKKRDNDEVERGSGGRLPTGNINYPGVKEYFEAQARLKANDYKKPSYRVHTGRDTNSSFYEISKTEYDYAQELKAKPTRETITPANDKNIGVNVDGNQLYERKDGSIYQMQDGKPRFSGFLEPVSTSKEAVALADTAQAATESVANGFTTWQGEFDKAKSDNDRDAMQNLYDKVRVSLNGPAQSRGDAAVQQFKKLKSDIEQYAAKDDTASLGLRSNASVAKPAAKPDAVAKTTELPDGDIRTVLDAARKYAEDNFGDKKVTNKDDGSEILIAKSGIRHALSSGAGRLDALAATDLENLIVNAKFQKSEPDKKGRKEIKAVHRYAATLDVDGEQKQIGVIVREHSDGRRYYDHFELRQKDASPLGTSGETSTGISDVLLDQPSGGDVISVPPAAPEVKAQQFTPADVAAAEKQAIGMLQAAIDKMKADAAQRFAVRFLPTMGVKVPVGKARINAAMTDPKINLMGAADALDVTFAKSINDALQAKQEGRISDAVEPQKAEKPTAIANTKEFTAIKRGDFYEIEGDNAKEAAKILGLTLTQNRDGVPMVGVPYHAYDRMVAELAKAGVVFEVKMPESASSASSASSATLSAEPSNTENAGEELKANRRGKRTTGLQWAEIEGKDAALRVAETVKAKVYPKPDYQAIADAATHPLVAYIVKLAYDAIAPKPNTATAPTDAQLKGYIEGVNAYMAGVLAWAGDAAKTKQWLVRQGTRAGVFLGASSGTTTALSGLNAVTEKTLLETVYPDGWRNHEAQVRLIGANKVLGALQPGLDDASKGMKELDKGWPSKQEAWQKQGYRIIKGDDLKPDYFENDTKGNERVSAYVQMRLGGRNVYVAQKSFNGITSRADPQVQAWVTEQMAKYQGQFLVMDKRNNVVDFAATEDAAKDKARERTKRDSGPDRIDEKGISVEAAKRTGVDRRMPGEDISADRLMQTYGFKGVNFGNWMLGDSNAKERQLHLNHAYDAFADLAEVLEIPPKAISMNGMLGFAVGAQGNGGRAAAHFVPGVNEINLTREAGAGALAHEWGHALDHYFAKLAGLDRETESYLTEHAHLGAKIQRIEKNAEGKHVNTTRDRFGPELRPEILERFKAIVQAMEKRPMTAEEVAAQKASYLSMSKSRLESWVKSVRKDFASASKDNAETLAAFDKLAEKITALDVGDGKIAASKSTYISPVVDELRSLYKKAAGRQYSIDQIKGLQSAIESVTYASKTKDDVHVPQTTSTKYASEAGKLDRDEDRKPPYWRTKLEMFARAFDAYVSDKLAAKAANNTYLHGLNKDERTVPVGDERTTINAQFDALVQTIETKETDGGNVAMFSQNLVAPQSTGPKPTLEQIQRLVDKVLQVAKNVIPVTVIGNPSQVPGVRVPVGSKPTGALIDGRIYLFADNIKSTGDAYVTLFHELFHLGLQKVIPAEDYASMLIQFSRNLLVQKFVRDWKASPEGVEKAGTMNSAAYEALATEEAMAMISEELSANDGIGAGKMPGLIKAMLSWFARAADRLGFPANFGNWMRKLTQNDAEKFVTDMVRASMGGDKILGRTQAKYGTTLAEMTAQTRLSAGKATNQTDSMAFKAWFSGSKVVDAEGKPLMVYHGTSADFAIFKPSHGDFGDGIYMTSDAAEASDYANNWSPTTAKDGANVMPVYASLQNPYYTTPEDRKLDSDVVRKKAEKLGHDGIIRTWKNSDQIHVIAFNPTQIKSAIGNNGNFDASNPDIRFSQGLGGTLSSAANSARDVNLPAGYKVADLFQGEGRLSYWHKSVGTMYNLAQRSPPFKRVFDSVQNFLNDVSFYAAEAADLAPSILPKLDKITDIAKSPLSAADTKALSRPVFEGTLTWGRDSTGTVKPMEEIEAALEELPLDERAHMLLQGRHVAPAVLRMWQGLPQDQYEAIINGKFEREFMKPGVVFKPAELREHFGMTDAQVAIYQEFRKATDKSIDNLAISEMLNYAGKDALPVREAVLASGSVQEAGQTLRDYLVSLTEMEPERDEALSATAAKMLDIAAHATDMKDRGYAPLSRFGNYTLEATLPTGERYFSLFETDRERNKMARMLTSQGATGVSAGTMSQEAYKLLNGITPETAALFGEMLGLESQGSEAKDLAFQEYIKRGTANRSAMKRLLQRKGIAGFSEDSGRVLAGFIYSNSRRTSSNLHAKETTEAVSAIPKEQGELKDTAVKLHEYVSNPAEEAQAFRGILFAQYLGGSVASAMVNATQPFTVTLPYLTQFGGVKKAAAQMVAAVRDATKDTTGNAALDAALKKAEEEGIVSPQEVHSLQAQAMGRAQLQAGDGTTMGNALAMGNNAISKMSLAWGKVFGLAEQFNRRTTFIAAYRTAIEQGIANPAKFAEKAVMETQFVYNKGNKPRWGRGAIGATLFTFKQYSVNYLEMVHRMATAGEPGSPERAAGRKAAALAIAILFMLAGSEGLPFVEDIEDVLDGALQRMGYNFSSKQSMKAFLVTQLGKDGAEFVTSGISGLPGAPIDVSGRLGMGNLIPGTGLFQKKTDHTRDLMELAGPAGDMIKRTGQATEQLLGGNVVGAAKTIAPTAARNLVKAYDMTKTGMYRDDKGSKIIDTDGFEAVAKAIGFQPRSVKNVQDASREVQKAKAQYTLASGEIRAKMAQAIFMADDDMKQDARDDVIAWNRNNPDQRMTIDMPTVLRKVREMRKSKEQRIADTAPKALRSQVREQLRGELH